MKEFTFPNIPGKDVTLAENFNLSDSISLSGKKTRSERLMFSVVVDMGFVSNIMHHLGEIGDFVDMRIDKDTHIMTLIFDKKSNKEKEN